MVLQIFHEADDASSFFWVFSLLRFESFAYLSILPAYHLNVFQADPELRGWLRRGWLLAIYLSLRVVCSIVRVSGIFVVNMGSTYTCCIDFALLKHWNRRDSSCWRSFYGDWRDISLVLANAASIITPLLGCWLYRYLLYYLEALNRWTALLLVFDQSWHVAVLDARYRSGNFLLFALSNMFGGPWVGIVVDEELRFDGTCLLARSLCVTDSALTASIRANLRLFIINLIDDIGGEVRLPCLDVGLWCVRCWLWWNSDWRW